MLITIHLVSGNGAVVKVVDSHFCGWSSISNGSCSFLIVFLSKGLSITVFMRFDQHIKYRMPRGLPSTNSSLLDYHVKQYIHTYSLGLANNKKVNAGGTFGS